MEDRNRPPEWMVDQVEMVVSQAGHSPGLPGVSMRVSRTADDGLSVFMHLDKAKRLRDALDAAIKAAGGSGYSQSRVEQLRAEFWVLEQDAPRPKPAAVNAQNIARRAAIKAELGDLGTTVGEKPVSFHNRYS